MKFIRLIFFTPYFLSLLMLREINCIKQYTYCKKDEIKDFSSEFFPIIYKNNGSDEYVFKENPQFLEQITSIDEELFKDDKILIYSNIQVTRLIQIYQREKEYLLQMNDLKLIIIDSKEYYTQMELNYSINFQIENCDKIIHVYYQKHQKFIMVCEQIENYQINIFKIYEQTIEIQQSFDILKQSECKFDVLSNENVHQSQFLVIYLNCLNWKTYLIEFYQDETQDFQLFINAQDFIENQKIESDNYEFQYVLRKITIDQTFYFQFDHYIYEFFQYSLLIIYQNKEYKILDFENKSDKYIIVLEQKINEQKNDIQRISQPYKPLIIITKQFKPKQILILFDSIVLLNESHLECIVRLDMTFLLHIKLESIQPQSFYPFFIGKYNNQIIFLKRNGYSSFLNCNDYSNQTDIYLASSNIFKETQFLSVQLRFTEFQQHKRANLFNYLSINKSIVEEEFEVNLKSNEVIEFFSISKIQFIRNEDIQCEEQSQDIIYDCLNRKKLDLLWEINMFYLNQIEKVVQLKNLQILLIKCNQNTSFELQHFEEVREENTYRFQNDLFLLNNKKKKILRITFFSKTKHLENTYEFRDEIINILYKSPGYQIVLQSCVSYLTLDGKQLIEQEDYKVNSIGQCIQERFVYNNFLEINQLNHSFIFKREFFTNIIHFQYQTIHFLYQYNQHDNSYLVLTTISNKIVGIKYKYQNLQLIAQKQILDETFNHIYPLKHSVNGFYLVIAAFDQQNNSVLLIYTLINDQKNSLIDIIKVDNFTFTLTTQNDIFFFHQGIQKKQTILEIKIKCRTNYFTVPIKKFKVPILLINKLNESLFQFDDIQINLINNFQNLIPLITQVFQFKYNSFQQFILFDPRKFVFGSIETISTNTFDLLYPLVKIDHIDRGKCQMVYNLTCINQNNESLIISNIFGTPNDFKTLNLNFKPNIMIFSSELYFILCYEEENDLFIIELYLKTTLENIANLKLIQQFDNSIQNIQIINQYYLIILKDVIYFYEVLNSKFHLITTQSCKLCSVKQINNSNLIAIYQNITIGREVAFIIFDCEKYEHFKVNLPINTQYFNQVGTELQFEIICIKLQDDNQYYAKLFISLSSPIRQIVDINFNKENINIDRTIILRCSQVTIQQQVIFMLNYSIILISYFDFEMLSQVITVYNISELNFVDRIYTLTIKHSSIQKYNESHFLVIANNDYSDFMLYQVDSYQIKIDNQQIKSFNLTFKNQVSHLEFQIDLQNEIEDKTFNIQLYIIIVWEIILFTFLFQRRRRSSKQFY